MASGSVTDDDFFSVIPDQLNVLGSLDVFCLSVASSAVVTVSIGLIGSISGKSGRMSSGFVVVLYVFLLFA